MDRKTTKRTRRIIIRISAFGILFFLVMILCQKTLFAVTLAPKNKQQLAQTLMNKVNKIKVDILPPVVYFVTDEERFWLEAIVFAEAGTTENLEGQVAIAAEVINRMESPNFPDNIIDVLMDGGQYYDDFPMWASEEGWRYVLKTDITDSVKFAVELAIRGFDPTEKAFENGAYFHYSPDNVAPDCHYYDDIWNTFSIGNHVFYDSWE